MNRNLSKLALGTSLVLLSVSSNVLAGRGGGYGGGGGYHGGQMGGGSMGHSPSFSQPHSLTSQSGSYGNHPQSGSGSGSQYPHAGAAGTAAGAGYSNRNQSSQYPHAGAAGAAAGAGYSNRNQSSQYPHAGAAGAAAGAGYADNHNGTWNGNNYAGWGATGLGTGYASGVGAWGAGSPMYGWGYSGYSNPYYGSGYGAGGAAQGGAVQQAVNSQPLTAAQGSNYSQPISTTAAAPDQAVVGQANASYDQARAAFKASDYAQAVQLDQQALAQTPNDTTMHEFLALAYFAQGKYQQAATPLYAVLSVRPGWDWTTLSGMYSDVDTYTRQLRALEAYVTANPDSAQGHFVLGYQYLAQGHDPNAIAQLKEVVRIQPGDTVSRRSSPRSNPQVAAHRRPPRWPRPLRRPSRGGWPGPGPPRRLRVRRLPCQSRTTARSPGPPPTRASRR